MPETENAGKIKYDNLAEPQIGNGWKNRREKRA